MRSYLLGTIDEAGAASIEERYFVDREFFLRVRAVERALIEEYLAGKLELTVRAQFESRYLEIPELEQRLMEVRAAVEARSRARVRVLGFAAAAIVCIGAAALWMVSGRAGAPGEPGRASGVPVIARLTLVPGLSKAEAPPSARMDEHRGPGRLQVGLELPGVSQPVSCLVLLERIEADGARRRLWTSGGLVRSAASGTGQEIPIDLDVSLIPHGDYLLDVRSPDDSIRETYYFHVSLH